MAVGKQCLLGYLEEICVSLLHGQATDEQNILNGNCTCVKSLSSTGDLAIVVCNSILS